jgi:hypothetical protein
VVDEQGPPAHGGHHGVGLAVVLGAQPGLGDGRPRRIPQLGEARGEDHGHEVRQVQQSFLLVDLPRLQPERLHQRVAQLGVHPRLQLQPDDVSEAALAQLGLHGDQEILRVLGDGEVRVPGDAEQAVVEHLHAGEQRAQVVGDDLLQRDEGRAALERDEARQHLLGHLHPGHRLLLGHGIPEQHHQAEREVGDVREVSAQPDGQRGEHGEDLLPEALIHLRARLRIQVLHGEDAQALLGERRAQLPLEAVAVAPALLEDARVQLVERVARGGAIRDEPGHAVAHLLVQPRHADHEELIEVARVDGTELQALHQRYRGVLGQLEHPVVEGEPRLLPVEEQVAVRHLRSGRNDVPFDGLLGGGPAGGGGRALGHSRSSW